jgi:PAT family beta-lactamase induction signal transducer AmpG
VSTPETTSSTTGTTRKAPAAADQKAPVPLPVIGALALAQEVPGALSGVLGSSVFRSMGASLDSLSLFALPQIPEALRLLWAPFVDNRRGGRLGARRSWIVGMAFVGLLIYLVAAAIPPTLGSMVAIIALLTLAQAAKATEAIAADAYTIEASAGGRRPGAAGAVFIGKEVGQLMSLLGLGLIYKFVGWQAAVAVAGLLTFLLSLAVLLRPEPALRTPVAAHPASTVRFLRQARCGRLLAVVFLNNFARSLFVAVFGAFLVDQGMSIAQIGMVAGATNTVGAVLAVLAVVPLVRRLGVKATLTRALALSVLALPALYLLATLQQPTVWQVAGLVFWLTVTTAPITISLLAARLNWTSASQTGTDYTVQSCAYLLGFVVALAVAGPVAQRIGWQAFFALQATLMLGCALLLRLWMDRIDADVAAWRLQRDGAGSGGTGEPA